MKLLFLLLLSFNSFAFSKSERHDLHEGKFVTIIFPDGWETVKGLFGIPLTLLGPWENESRPAMSFLYTGMAEKNFPKSEFQKLFTDFKAEKEAWVKKHKGELVLYEPMTPVKFANAEGHFIGAEFKIDDVHFIERSYYLTCEGEVYNLKYSIRDEHRKHLKNLADAVETFRCK